MTKTLVGFSTGALERGDYQSALKWMLHEHVNTVELSALRFNELEPLVNDLAKMDLDKFAYASFHVPSAFAPEQECRVVELLSVPFARRLNLIVHPDVVYTPVRWKHFGSQLLIENMDRRKRTGRTIQELRDIFAELPDARLCLDVAHARQMDTTLTLLRELTSCFRERIAELHVSQLDSWYRHCPLSQRCILDYRSVTNTLRGIPVIIESMLGQELRQKRHQEVELARAAVHDDCE